MHLSEYMAQQNLSDAEVATAIERSRPTVSRLRRGKMRPDWDTIERLRRFTDGQVTADDFVRIEAAE